MRLFERMAHSFSCFYAGLNCGEFDSNTTCGLEALIQNADEVAKAAFEYCERNYFRMQHTSGSRIIVAAHAALNIVSL